MVAQTELQHSLDMIERSKRRLLYQRLAVKKLSLDRDARSAELAREMEAMMEAKLALLEKRHSTLVTTSSNVSGCVS